MIGWPASDSLWMSRAPVPRGALPEPLGGGVRLRLGRVERALRRLPRRDRGRVVDRVVGLEMGPVERLGHRPDALGPEAQRLALVVAEVVRPAAARVERQDRHVLAELPEARDQPAAGERDVVGMRGDEHVGHGAPSIPRATGPGRFSRRARPAAAPTSGTNTHGPSERSRHSLPCRSTTIRLCSRRAPDRDHQPPAVAELLAQRVGDRRRGRGDEDAVPRRAIRGPEAAVADADPTRSP